MELYSGDAYMEELMKAKNQLTTPAKKRNLADITNSPSRSSPLKKEGKMTPASKRKSSTHRRSSTHAASPVSAKKMSTHKSKSKSKASFMAAISKLATPSKKVQIEKSEEKDKTHDLETRYLAELTQKELSCASAQREQTRLESENALLAVENAKLKRRVDHLENEVHELKTKSKTDSHMLQPQANPKEIQSLQEKVEKLRSQKREMKLKLTESAMQAQKLNRELTVATTRNWKEFCSCDDVEPQERPAKRQKTAAHQTFKSLVDIE